MKKILFLALLAFGLNTKAQITFEHRYDSASTFGVRDLSTSQEYPSQLMIINFEVSGERYVKINRIGLTIDIYSMNHSFIKSISYAGFPQACNHGAIILYLSEHLFDLDSEMEFMYVYPECNGEVGTGIYKEDGTCIFSVDSMGPYVTAQTPQQQIPIYNTSYGTKMILSEQSTFKGGANVYSLPGTLTVDIQNANNSLIAAQSQSLISNPYPNPTNNTTTIDYTLPIGINEGEIVFYNLQGAEVKRFKVDKTFSTLLVSTTDIAAGTYLYQLQTSGQSSEGKKMVVIK